jgi:two-component system chemotaxis sensor kinase CheA
MKHKFNDYSPENKDALKGGATPFSLPEYLDEDIFNEFLNEQDNVLANLENHLLSLEKNIDKETLDDLHRIFHTLKGEAAVFDLHDIQKLCHKAEDLIDCSSDNLSIDVLLNVKDWLKYFFETLKLERKVIKLNENMLSILRLQNYESAPEEPDKVENTSAPDVFSTESLSQHKKSKINESIKVS